MINNLAIDASSKSINKFHEELCGDNVEIIKSDENLMIAVLADGLGSGVKANILSILTSKILSTMLVNRLSIEVCVKTLASILPICKVRNIAYSTFTAVKITNNNLAEIVEFDNPQLIVLRHGKAIDISRTSTKIDEKIVYLSKLDLELDDLLVSVSDGAIYAGVGHEINFGWQRESIVKFLEDKYNNTLTARTIASMVVDKCNALYENNPGDDTTCCVLKVIERKSANILIGPPASVDEDSKMMKLFLAKEGVHIVCGGTTAMIASRYLGKTIDCDLDINNLDPEVPPISYIEGIDLVTEGVLTLNKVLSYLKDYLNENKNYYYWIGASDGASQITRLLVEDTTDINFFVGTAVNPAHQNKELHIDISIKIKLIEEIKKYLEMMDKKVNISYF